MYGVSRPTNTAPLSNIDQQITNSLRTVKFNQRNSVKPIAVKIPVDRSKPVVEAPVALASYVTFPDSQESAIVPVNKQQLATVYPSNQGFVDHLCALAVKEVRKLPLLGGIPKQFAQDLCVLGIKSGIRSVPKLVNFVKSQFMARKNSRGKTFPVMSKLKTSNRIAPAMQSMSISAPVAVGKRIASRNRPKFLNRNGNVVISHTEFVGNLFSNATTLLYNSTSFVINPGNCGTFPWLSTFSSNFDKYKIHKLVFHIVSNQPTSIAGRIGVGVDYDSTDPVPADRGEFFNLTHHQETAPWDSIVMNIPVKPEEKFINSHTVTDSKLIDYGQIIVMADQIVATSSNLADIIVEYVVELIQPQQAVFTTQLISGVHPAAFTDLTTVGPVIAKLVPTTSTTVLEVTVPAGYYHVTNEVYDAGSGSPLCAVTGHSCVGSVSAATSATFNVSAALIKATGPDSTLKFTFSAVGIVSIENIVIAISRISATVYGARSYVSALTTY
jgi:hypothetical protein